MGILMGEWEMKIVFLLVIYFAGFATAIYCLAPVPEDQEAQFREKGFVYSALKSDKFAQSFNVKVHDFIDFARSTALRAEGFIKQKIDERQADS